jgi:hypothetical protein
MAHALMLHLCTARSFTQHAPKYVASPAALLSQIAILLDVNVVEVLGVSDTAVKYSFPKSLITTGVDALATCMRRSYSHLARDNVPVAVEKAVG